jgi:hypothetical protein
MDNHYPITDRIELIAAHHRLIADLLLNRTDLKEVDCEAFALVMEDLASRLEQAVRDKASAILGMNGMDRERQP